MQLHVFVALALACVLQTMALTTPASVSARQVAPPHTAGCCDGVKCYKGMCPRQVVPPHTEWCCDKDYGCYVRAFQISSVPPQTKTDGSTIHIGGGVPPPATHGPGQVLR
ncbi:hypothetical protein B0H13DRAFT_2386209 [Mycena leptocephala]|nr:hypothetical protein B0H13DRAFT_2386209 [Mycena leptocephala]